MHSFPKTYFAIYGAISLLLLTASSMINSKGIENIRNSIPAYLQESGLRGAAVTIVQHGNVVLSEGFGRTASGRPIVSTTPMYIGSLSKSFTALAVLQLAEQRKIALDDPVVKYLPGFVMDDVRFSEITVKDLLQHRSGLSDKVHPEMSSEQPTSLAESVEALRTVKLDSQPGEAYHYHNPNYQIAARIVEVVSKKPFNEYLKENIFSPLGMSKTIGVTMTPDENRLRIAGLEKGGNYIFGIFVPREESYRFVAGSHGVISNAADMGKWLAFLSDSQAGRRIPPVIARHSVRMMLDEDLGLSKYPGGGELRYSHSGSTFTYSGEITYFPKRDVAISVLTNSRAFFDIGFPLTERIVALVEGKGFEKGAPTPLYADIVMAILMFFTILLGIIGIKRASLWSENRSKSPPALGIIRLIPSGLVLLIIIFTPKLIGLMGRDVSWAFLWHLWPMLALWLVLVGVTVVVVGAVRIWRWRRRLAMSASQVGGVL